MATDTEIMTEDVLLTYDTVPVAALKFGARKLLAKYLNLVMEIPTDDGYLPDFTGVAEIMGFDYADQKNFAMKSEPTLALLDEWQGQEGATLGRLCRILMQLNRLDILVEVSKLFERDAKAWINKQNEWRECSAPVQDQTVSQSSRQDDRLVDQYRYMVRDDIGASSPCMFDAFVCSANEDLHFVKKMIKHLENEHHLKLCIPERDLLPGGSDSTITGNLIEKRCKRMVAVMSPSYLRSPQCDFQTMFAHALSPGSRSKKVVPVMLERCEMPAVLRHVTFCDYTRPEVHEWFWGRLAKAIAAPLRPSDVQLDERRLSAITLDLGSSSLSSINTESFSISTSC